ncbi:histone-like nucleoid-structuring protein Lsr2 [Streptomyces sp. NPDC004682]
MAQKIQVTYVDDLDGGEAEGTVSFGLDGRTYDIDLSAANDAKLREFLAPFIAAGRRTAGGPGRKPGSVNRVPSGPKPDLAKVREWARENGYNVNDRGRIPGTVLEAYEKANA